MRSVNDYVRQYIRDDNLENIILNVEANNLESENSSGKIAKSIVDLAKSSIFEKEGCHFKNYLKE